MARLLSLISPPPAYADGRSRAFIFSSRPKRRDLGNTPAEGTIHSMTDTSSIPRLKRLIPRLRNKRIAVLGDLMLDRYLWGTATRLSPEAAVPVVDFVSQSDCLGGAGNVAANLSGLGAQVALFGVVGGRKAGPKIADDEAGEVLRACVRSANI